MSDAGDCRLVSGAESLEGSQGITYFTGVAAESAGARRICMHVGTVPPGGAAVPHLHEGHESVVYVLGGRGGMLYGERLEHRLDAGPGDFVYIGGGVPHQPFNESESEPVRYVVARTDASEQESVVLLPELAPYAWRRATG